MSPSSKSTRAPKKKGPAAAGQPRAAESKKVQPRTRKASKADSNFDHSPIIITDGSASVEFAEQDYPLSGNVHASKGFSLDSVIVRRNPNGPIIHTCATFTGTARHRIEAVCRVGGDSETITVEGAAAGGPSKSPTIEFSHQEFAPNASFPPAHGGRRFVHANRRVIRLLITRISTGAVVHDCPLVPGGGVEYTINEIEDHD
jgi:hypothetical protein